ncbi:MAG TPA: hypothetical protein VFS40_14815 [Gemmatimonadales bacterium]|nr:hypothetical protein [Gemmatimonadales bacterium]
MSTATCAGATMSRRDALRLLGLTGIALAAGSSLACGAGGARAPAPAPIAYGRDECAWCRMPIDDPALAAELVPARGAAQLFGEPGCLLAWLAAHPAAQGTAFVADAGGAGWLPAADARFVRGRVRTPMAFDLAAWRTLPADVSPGAALTWAALRQEGAPRAEAR